MSQRHYVRSLLFASALASPFFAGQALAQAQGADEATGLEQVVVTATRQTDTVNRVPLSIAAVTQAGLDQQGIKNAPDLIRTVPGLNATGAQNGVAIFSIRGIVATVGAATTGIYLDDTSVSKRANTGIAQNNGAPAPLLFDLERVEVLKGPQGTLYGGSSEGGTIRYITPTPSLTTTSGALRIEGDKYKAGDEGYDIGASVGGPIVKDKLAFRISGLRRKTPGYIDVYSPYDNSLLGKDVNGRTEHALRGALLWQITDRASALLSVYSTKGVTKGDPRFFNSTVVYGPDGKPAAANQTFTTPRLCYDVANYLSIPQGQPNSKIGTRPAPPADGCARSGQPGIFTRPSFTYGPFRQLTKDEAFAVVGQGRVLKNPTDNEFDVGSLTLNYDFDNMTVKSITSYVQDWQGYYSSGGEDPNTSQSTLEAPGKNSFPLFALAGASGLIGDYTGGFSGKNERYGLQQELRFSSKADARPFSWVAGLYYSNARTHIRYAYPNNGDRISQAFWGLTADQRYGINLTNGQSFNPVGLEAYLDAQIHDNELAAFADGNYWLTDKLKFTAGVRLSRVQLSYFQLAYGQFDQRGPESAQSITNGSASASPVTPKVGLQYQFTADDLVYVTASKGFRAGGVNPQVSDAFCHDGLVNAGITSNQVPVSYGPDTVWSYEAGGKFRLLDNKMQLNGAVYRIDWSGVQATIPLTCGFNFVMNGGRARSEGADFQAQYRPIRPLTLTLNVGYTNARYIDGVAGPNPQSTARPSINAGDGFNIPKWQVSASGQFDQDITTAITGYLRADFQYQGKYLNGTSYGTSPYNYFTRNVNATYRVNARVGLRFDNGVDVNLYANNLFNARAKVGNAGVGRTNCAAGSVDCSVYSNFTPFVSQAFQPPRMIGFQANYSF